MEIQECFQVAVLNRHETDCEKEYKKSQDISAAQERSSSQKLWESCSSYHHFTWIPCVFKGINYRNSKSKPGILFLSAQTSNFFTQNCRQRTWLTQVDIPEVSSTQNCAILKRPKRILFPTYLNFIPHEPMVSVSPLLVPHPSMVGTTGHVEFIQCTHHLLSGLSCRAIDDSGAFKLIHRTAENSSNNM